MDPDFLKNLDLFTAQNNQGTNQPGQGAESAAGTISRYANEAAFWEALAGAESGNISASPSNNPHSANPTRSSVAPADLAYRFGPGRAHHTGSKRNPSSRAPGNTTNPRRREGHDKKRQRADPEAAALESVDYWIQFDDDEADAKAGGSFEIDFSKRQGFANNFARPASRLNPLPTTPGLGTGLYTNPPIKEDDFLDENALDNVLSEDEDFMESINLSEQLSNIDTQPPPEVPPREGLYSTPLSWERPAPGLRMNPLFGLGTPMLDPEQRRLLAIALNTGSSTTALAASGFGLGLGGDLGSEYPSVGNLSSGAATASLNDIYKGMYDEPLAPKGKGKEKETDTTKLTGHGKQATGQRPPNYRTPSASTPNLKDKGKGNDRTAHNDIERKYRTNLKDKIGELRDAVPSLRSLSKEGEDEDEEDDDPSRSTPKVSKGTILLKATEYIQQLEKRNQAIMKEHQNLARRLQAFEQLLTATARQPFPMPNYSRTLFDPRGFC